MKFKQVFLIFFVMIYMSFVSCADSNEITVYELECEKESFVPHYQPLMIKKYKVFPNTQQVIRNWDDVITKYEDCEVYDEANWSCKLKDKDGEWCSPFSRTTDLFCSNEIQLQNGKFIPSYYFLKNSTYFGYFMSVSGIDYYRFKILSFIYIFSSGDLADMDAAKDFCKDYKEMYEQLKSK